VGAFEGASLGVDDGDRLGADVGGAVQIVVKVEMRKCCVLKQELMWR
jgi:hypothetical protein